MSLEATGASTQVEIAGNGTSMAGSVVVVTGAAGLVGGAVCARLAEQGRAVVALDRIATSASREDLIRVDLTDVHGLYAAVGDRRLDGVVHCGAFSGPMVARDRPYDMVQVNIVGTANLLELARNKGARRFVYCSSTSAYGDTGSGPVGEDAPLHPSSVYGASKVAGEALVRGYAAQYGLDGVSLRLSWIFGPRRSTDCVIRTMITDAQAGRPTQLPCGNNFPRQFIHVDDAARVLTVALDAPAAGGRAYNVTGGTFLTLSELAKIVRRVLPQARITLADGPDPVDDLQHRFDTRAVARDLGFTPQVGLEDGIRAYADWLSRTRPEAG